VSGLVTPSLTGSLAMAAAAMPAPSSQPFVLHELLSGTPTMPTVIDTNDQLSLLGAFLPSTTKTASSVAARFPMAGARVSSALPSPASTGAAPLAMFDGLAAPAPAPAAAHSKALASSTLARAPPSRPHRASPLVHSEGPVVPPVGSDSNSSSLQGSPKTMRVRPPSVLAHCTTSEPVNSTSILATGTSVHRPDPQPTDITEGNHFAARDGIGAAVSAASAAAAHSSSSSSCIDTSVFMDNGGLLRPGLQTGTVTSHHHRQQQQQQQQQSSRKDFCEQIMQLQSREAVKAATEHSLAANQEQEVSLSSQPRPKPSASLACAPQAPYSPISTLRTLDASSLHTAPHEQQCASTTALDELARASSTITPAPAQAAQQTAEGTHGTPKPTSPTDDATLTGRNSCKHRADSPSPRANKITRSDLPDEPMDPHTSQSQPEPPLVETTNASCVLDTTGSDLNVPEEPIRPPPSGPLHANVVENEDDEGVPLRTKPRARLARIAIIDSDDEADLKADAKTSQANEQTATGSAQPVRSHSRPQASASDPSPQVRAKFVTGSSSGPAITKSLSLSAARERSHSKGPPASVKVESTSSQQQQSSVRLTASENQRDHNPTNGHARSPGLSASKPRAPSTDSPHQPSTAHSSSSGSAAAAASAAAAVVAAAAAVAASTSASEPASNPRDLTHVLRNPALVDARVEQFCRTFVCASLVPTFPQETPGSHALPPLGLYVYPPGKMPTRP
jgi:hypothetical protein